MVAPINSIKHYVHRVNTSVASGAILNDTVVDAVVAPATTNAFDVVQGSQIKAVYIEMWVLGNGATGTTCQFNLAIIKLPSNLTEPTFSNLVNLGGWTNKKNVLYTTQGVMGSNADGTAAIPAYRAWIKIPKGKQRMGLGDRIIVAIGATGQALQACGIYTYKEYT